MKAILVDLKEIVDICPINPTDSKYCWKFKDNTLPILYTLLNKYRGFMFYHVNIVNEKPSYLQQLMDDINTEISKYGANRYTKAQMLDALSKFKDISKESSYKDMIKAMEDTNPPIFGTNVLFSNKCEGFYPNLPKQNWGILIANADKDMETFCKENNCVGFTFNALQTIYNKEGENGILIAVKDIVDNETNDEGNDTPNNVEKN